MKSWEPADDPGLAEANERRRRVKRAERELHRLGLWGRPARDAARAEVCASERPADCTERDAQTTSQEGGKPLVP